MNERKLRLREGSDLSGINAEDLHQHDRVNLYSEYYEQAFTVEITHKHGEEFGGDVVETTVEDPMIGKRDIIHFRPQHVQSIE